jgi:hypothetical protein
MAQVLLLTGITMIYWLALIPKVLPDVVVVGRLLGQIYQVVFFVKNVWSCLIIIVPTLTTV